MISELLSAALEDVFSFGVMVIVTLAIVITIHEFGHFIAARICGVRVETFAFGFGREIFGFGGRKNSTRWSIRLFPLGGFVKLFGDVDKNKPIVWDHENDCERRLSDEELEVAFCTKSVWQRMFIVAAGPGINILLTLVILIGLFTTHGQRSRPPIINVIAKGSAADEAGIQPYDHILEMDDKPIRRLEDIYDYTWYEDPPEPHRYLIDRNGERLEIEFSARRLEYINNKGVEQKHGQTGMVRMSAIKLGEGIYTVDGQDVAEDADAGRDVVLKNFDRPLEIGIPFRGYKENRVADPFVMTFASEYNQHLLDPDDEHYDVVYLVDPESEFFVRLGFFEAVQRSIHLLSKGVSNSYKTIEAGLAGRNDDAVVGGVAKISENTGNAVKAGFYSYMMFIAVFSFMIAIINLFPIPALDGGYLVFMLYEVVTGRAISPRIQDIALIVGMGILLGIMIFANISDLLKLLFPVK